MCQLLVIVVAGPAKRGEGLPRVTQHLLSAAAPHMVTMTVLSSVWKNIIFTTPGLTKNGESLSKENGVATPSPQYVSLQSRHLQQHVPFEAPAPYLYQHFTKVELQHHRHLQKLNHCKVIGTCIH